MDCCVCYNSIKNSYITCHELCNKCYKRIKDNKCPICREQMIMKNPKIVIEVECLGKSNTNTKTINISRLKQYIFSKHFKQLLIERLNINYIKFTDWYCIIDKKKYDYGEILDDITFNKLIHMSDNKLIHMSNIYCDSQIILLIDKLIGKQPMKIKDLFCIKNLVHNRNNYWSNPSKRVLEFIWDKTKLNY